MSRPHPNGPGTAGPDTGGADAGDADVLGADAPGPDVWQRLTALARAACTRAYVPYSRFPVGAAALVDDGRYVSGCNVENAGYGVTLCAECGLVSDLVLGGGGRLVAFACVGADGEPLTPCGRCRQLLAEHAAPGMVLAVPGGRATIEEMLPGAFGSEDIDRIAAWRADRAPEEPT